MSERERFDYIPRVGENMRSAILDEYRFEIYPREVDGYEYSEYVILKLRDKAENAWHVLVLDGMPTQDLAEQECRKLIGQFLMETNKQIVQDFRKAVHE